MHSIPRPPRFVKRAAPAKRKIQQGGKIGRSRQAFGQTRTTRSSLPMPRTASAGHAQKTGRGFPAAGGIDFSEHDWAIFPCQCASKACATPHFRPGPRQSAPPPAPPAAHFRGLRNHISCSRGIIHSKSRQAKTQGGLSVELCSHGCPSRFRPVQHYHTRPPPPLPERRALIRAG